MIDYDDLDGIVGCYYTLVYYGHEVIVRLNNGKELTEYRSDVLIYE